MSYSEIGHNTGQSQRILRFFRFLEFAQATSRRNRLDLQSTPDDILDDIGLSPEDRLSDLRDIDLMDANIRSGIILPRPC